VHSFLKLEHMLRVPLLCTQDVLDWLSKLRLDLVPSELSTSLLRHPIRNGLLLAGVAAALTGESLSAVACPVKSLAAARGNLLRAAAHLGMIGSSFATAAAAAAAAKQDQAAAAAAAAPAVGGRSRSCSRDRSGSRSVSPCREHGWCASVEWWQLPGGQQGCSGRDISPGRNNRNSSSCTTAADAKDGAAVCECFYAAAAATAAGGIQGSVAGLQILTATGTCCCSCWCCTLLEGKGSMLEHAVLQLLEQVLAGDGISMWGLLYALQQRWPVPLSAAPFTSQAGLAIRQLQRRRQMQQQLHLQQRRQQGAAGTRGRGSLVTVQPHTGPCWRTFQMPCSAQELDM
jgi:hypothetical protein